MNVHFFNEENNMPHVYHEHTRASTTKKPKKYGFFKFIFDIVMTILTGGFWLIWIFVREMRKR